LPRRSNPLRSNGNRRREGRRRENPPNRSFACYYHTRYRNKKTSYVRKKQKSKKPTFKQTDSHKKKKLADYWRKPDGIHNKTRYAKHGKCPLVEAGYGSPAAVRGLHPSGFEEIIVNNIKDVESLKTDRQAGRIGRTVGTKKRSLIEKKAAELGLKILNPTRKVE